MDRVPGSGIKKGYSYEGYYSKKQLAAQERRGELMRNREITWADKISEGRKARGDVSDLMVKAWRVRRDTYKVVAPDGTVHRTQNLTKFCKKHNLSASHMCRIAKWYSGEILGGSRYHKKYDCYKVGDKKRRDPVGYRNR